MKSNILLRWALLICGIAGIIIFLVANFYNTESPTPIVKMTQGLLDNKIVESIKNTVFGDQNSGLPTRLKIPAINVDANIEYVGLTPDGSMDAPKGPSNVAWFQPGPRPGDNGSAVIAGHFGPWKSGAKSVFDDLTKLKAGDEIYVVDEKGATTTFAVRELRTFDPKAESSTIFGANNNTSHLNLITCEGVWDGIKKTYSNRLVVFADRMVK